MLPRAGACRAVELRNRIHGGEIDRARQTQRCRCLSQWCFRCLNGPIAGYHWLYRPSNRHSAALPWQRSPPVKSRANSGSVPPHRRNSRNTCAMEQAGAFGRDISNATSDLLGYRPSRCVSPSHSQKMTNGAGLAVPNASASRHAFRRGGTGERTEAVRRWSRRRGA